MRDKLDSEREVAPLKKAEDAVEIDTTSLTLMQVVEEIMELVKERMGTALNLYPLVVRSVMLPFFPFIEFKVIGRENFPKKAGFCFVPIIFIILIQKSLGLQHPGLFILWQKKNYSQFLYWGKFYPHINAFPVKRGMSDREALRAGLKILKEGKVFGLFPEGTRSKTGEIGKGLPERVFLLFGRMPMLFLVPLLAHINLLKD